MSGDSRMYTRQRGDAPRRSSSTESTKPAPSENPQKSVSHSSFKTNHNSDFAISKQVFDKYHGQMGVSSYTLRAMYRRVELTELTGLETQVTSAQMARVGSFGKNKSKEFEEKLNSSSISDLDAELLEFALQMKPVDILCDILDEHQNSADVRTLIRCVNEDTLEEESDLPDDPRLRDALNAYQEVVDADVALMTGTGKGDKHSQVRDVALLAQECYAKFDAIIKEPSAAPEVSNAPQPDEPLTVAALRAKEEAGAPKRITAETMKTYTPDKL